MRFVVIVVSSEEGVAKAYGSWRDVDKAFEFADKLIERDLSAQIEQIEKPTIHNVRKFFGEEMSDG